MTVTSTFMGRALALNESGCLDLVLAPSGASALEGIKLDVTDTTTYSSGYGSALYLHVSQAGAKTGNANTSQFNAIALDLTIKAAGPYIVGQYFYICQSGSPDLSAAGILGQVIFLDELGATGYIHMLSLQKANTTKATGYDTFIQMACQGSGVARTAIFLTGTHNPDYFLQFQSTADCISASSGAVPNATYKLLCKIGATDAYLHFGAS